MGGVEHATSPDASAPRPRHQPATEPPDDAAGGVEHGSGGGADEWSPAPWRPWWTRLVDRVSSPLRPWVTWFGAGRLAAGALTIAVAVGIGWWLLRPAEPPTEARLPYAGSAVTTGTGAPTSSSTPSLATDPTTPTVVIVHVAGAVGAPGVVELVEGARVADGVARAGGALPEADLGAVNLAARLQDGQQVYVPRVGEVPPPPAPPTVPGVAAGQPAAAGPIDVNRASLAELDALPGIGPATAAAIVAHRDTNGPFASVEDLEAVRGIGPAKLDALRGLVTT